MASPPQSQLIKNKPPKKQTSRNAITPYFEDKNRKVFY